MHKIWHKSNEGESLNSTLRELEKENVITCVTVLETHNPYETIKRFEAIEVLIIYQPKLQSGSGGPRP